MPRFGPNLLVPARLDDGHGALGGEELDRLHVGPVGQQPVDRFVDRDDPEELAVDLGDGHRQHVLRVPLAVDPLPDDARRVQLVVELGRDLETAMVEQIRPAQQHLRLHRRRIFFESHPAGSQLLALLVGQPDRSPDLEYVVGHPQVDGGTAEAAGGRHRLGYFAQDLVEGELAADLSAGREKAFQLLALRFGDGDGGALDGSGTNDLETDDRELGERLEKQCLARRRQLAGRGVVWVQVTDRLPVGSDQRRKQERAGLPGPRRHGDAGQERAGDHLRELAHRVSGGHPAHGSDRRRRLSERFKSRCGQHATAQRSVLLRCHAGRRRVPEGAVVTPDRDHAHAVAQLLAAVALIRSRSSASSEMPARARATRSTSRCSTAASSRSPSARRPACVSPLKGRPAACSS